eukprot:TRINITY_DN7259_c0_g1_i2.p2 TRINITY_DN7259_c0_g1~~TRINITY_DN7259_c0_g1_i2.p2  ORF type:complete len:185 (-),score=47.35 TRINITY_DN7259_c0_g1_i2:387-941(-)
MERVFEERRAARLAGRQRERRIAPYFPTPLVVARAMLALADVSAEDFVIDVGSGDGRTVRMAAEEFGARAKGIEIDAQLVAQSQYMLESAGISESRAQIILQDCCTADYSEATVVVVYMGEPGNIVLQNVLESLAANTRVVSHSYPLEYLGKPLATRTLSCHEAAADGAHAHVVTDFTVFLYRT